MSNGFFVAEQEFCSATIFWLFCYPKIAKPAARPADCYLYMLPQNKNYVKTLPVLNSLLQQHFRSATVFPFRNSISINTVKIVRSATVVTISVLEWGFPNNTVRLQFFLFCNSILLRNVHGQQFCTMFSGVIDRHS